MRLSRTAKSRGPGAPMQALRPWIRTTGDGGNQAWSPGRSRISRNTIVQGMPAVAVYPWLLTPVLFFCTGGHGCNAHPAFPAPSVVRAGHLGSKLARNRRRDREAVATILSRPILRDAAGAAPQDEVVTCGATLDPRGEEARKRRLEP